LAQLKEPSTKYYPLTGGLDVVTPAIQLSPGYAIAMQNYEPWFNGGYRRVAGYERFDGRPKPSEQTFIGFDVSDASSLSIGSTVTGDTSTATGIVAGIWIDDGTYGTDVIGVTKIVGTFLNGEPCNTADFTIDSEPTVRYTPTLPDSTATSDLELAWLLQAQNDYRADIAVVPGSGDVRGAWQRNAFVYAVRDNVGATAGILHLASASGWTTTGVSMMTYLYFDTGGGGAAVALPAEGTTINGQTSGATGVVHRVIVHGGATATNDAYGYIVLRSVVGTFVNTENLRVVAVKFAEATSGSTLFAFPPGGTYRFKNHNFFGGSATYRTYGVNGVGPAFEIDENNRVSPILLPLDPITGQPPTNVPYLVEEHRQHLFLAFPGGIIVHAVVGQPLTINGFLGAAEFGLGSEITGMISQTGGVLVIFTKNDAQGLFGKGIADWELSPSSEKKGTQLFSAQSIDTIYTLDSLGISSLARTQAFGSFAGSTISQRVQPVVAFEQPLFTDTSIVRSANQYRLYFSDNTAIVMYVPQSGATEQAYQKNTTQFGFILYPIPFKKVYNTEDQNGAERTYVCSAGGFVFEDRKGTNFDGAEIESFIRLAFNHVGSPAYNKFYRRALIELQAQKPLHLKFTYDFSYASGETEQGEVDIDIAAGGGQFDFDNWDECFWDNDIVSSGRAPLGGSGDNIGILFFNSSAVASPYVLQGITLVYDLRRLKR
jgi:hypothetical protein